MSTPVETERKFLIRMPDADLLNSFDGLRIMDMEQTYLLCEIGNARVRKINENGNERYIKTLKRRISALSCYEEEREISYEEYVEALKASDPDKKTVYKTRYAFPYGSHTVEIDVYPFWSDRAILEVELSEENEIFKIPDSIRIIKEVSEDSRYKNTNIANCIPMDDIR